MYGEWTVPSRVHPVLMEASVTMGQDNVSALQDSPEPPVKLCAVRDALGEAVKNAVRMDNVGL